MYMRRKQDWSHRRQRERESSGDMPLKGQNQVHHPIRPKQRTFIISTVISPGEFLLLFPVETSFRNWHKHKLLGPIQLPLINFPNISLIL